MRYEGEWDKGAKHGKGVLSYPTEYFVGTYTQGSRTTGKYHYNDTFRLQFEKENSTIYETDMQYDEPWLLRLAFNDSVGKYQGQVSNKHLRDGVGVQYYANNSYYIGHFRNDKWTGLGRYVTAQGDACEGMWFENEFTGWGNCSYINGTIKSGQWRTGKFQGLGQIQERRNRQQSLGAFESDTVEDVNLQYANAMHIWLGIG